MFAVFYDVENLISKNNYEKAIKLALELCNGKPVVQFAYADWNRFDASSRNIFIENGIILKQVVNNVLYSDRIKNIADIALSVDAIELLFKNNNLNHFIIVSGDGGYVSLANKLKEYGKTVGIVSLFESLNSTLKNYVDNVVLIDPPVGKEGIQEDKNKQNNLSEDENKTAYKKALWAIFKSYSKHNEIAKRLYRNFSIQEQLKKEGIDNQYLLYTYSKAINKPIKSKEVQEFSDYFKKYIHTHQNLNIKDGVIVYLENKNNSKMTKQIDSTTPLERKKVIEYFKDAGIDISSTNITALLIDEVVKNKVMYLSLKKEDFIRLLKENTKRSLKLVNGVANIFYLLDGEEILYLNYDNYKDLLASKLSTYIKTHTKHVISKQQIKLFFNWEEQ